VIDATSNEGFSSKSYDMTACAQASYT